MIKLLLALAAGAALILILAQLFLPGIAANRISSRVGRYGRVASVSVNAWPAVELLWGRADSVSVRARRLSLSPAQAAKLLWEARGVNRLDLSAPSVQVGPLRLTEASLHKQGSSLTADATAAQSDVSAALPPGLSVRLLGSKGGQVEVRASGGLFGVGASVRARAGPKEGKLVVHPVGFGIEGLSLTLFSDPHVYVEGVGASPLGDSTAHYRLVISARLR